VDFVPTFLEAAGAPRPSGYRPDGVSFLPAVREGRPLPRGAVYSEVGVTRSVIKGRYHYIAFRPTASQIASMESGKVRTALDHWGRPLGGDNHWLLPYKPAFFDPDQLYDMEGDPLERTNLAGDPAHAAVLAEMEQELAKYLAGFKTPFPMEVSPFVSTPRYAELVAARRAAAAKGNYWPGYPEEDWERNINLNLKTPEEVDPSHRSAWQGKARDQASNVERQTSDAQRSTTEEPDEAE
jgi:arylsulfatase A-like enzyme